MYDFIKLKDFVITLIALLVFVGVVFSNYFGDYFGEICELDFVSIN